MTTSVSEANIGYLGEIRRGNGLSPQVFTAVAEVTSFGELGAESSLLDVTHLQSPNGSLEYISGMDDGAELALVCNFRPDHATQSYAAGLIHDQVSKTKRDFQAYHPDWPQVAHFSALVKGYKLGAIEPNVPQKVTFTLKISGGIVWS